MDITVSDLKDGETAEVIKINGGFGMQQHLASLGIKTGIIVKRLLSGREQGPVMVEVKGHKIVIGRGMAANISIREAQDK